MTKRQDQALARKQEEQAVRMYARGATLKRIKQVTTVPGWVVKGLVVASALSRFR